MANVVGSASIRITPDLSGFRQKLDNDLRASLAGLKVDVKVSADTAAAKAELAALQQQVDRLDRSRVSVTVDVDTARANAALAETGRLVSRLDGDRIKVQVDADTAAAMAQLRALQAEARRVNSTRINIDTSSIISGFRSMALAIAGVIPVAGSLVAALAPLVGLLGAIPGALVGLGQSAGALGLAFSGIGGAIKEVTSAHKGAAAAATSSGKSQVAAANQIKSAQESVASATRALANVRRDNAEAARQDAQDVKDAQESVRDAYREAAEVETQSMRRIADAAQRLKDVHQRASEQQVEDLRDIADAQKDAQEAQEDLNKARRQAVKDLNDLNDAAKDSTLDARQAELDYQEQILETGKVLGDSTKSALDKAQAQLDLEQAQFRLEQANKRQTESAEKANDANKKGVEGSERVAEAKDKIVDAEQRVTDAQDKAAKNREEAARNIADAERDVADAREQANKDRLEALKNIDKAEAGLAEAQRKRHQNELDRKDALLSAQTQLKQAQRSLQDAHRAAAEAAEKSATAVGKVNEAYGKLTPAGKAFVDQFVKVRDTIKDIGRAVQEATLPGFTQALKDIDEVLPSFKDVLKDTGQAFGDFAAAVGGLLKGEFGTQLHGIMESNVGVIRNLLGVDNGGGMLGLIEAMGNIMTAAQPLVEWLGEIGNKFGLWAKEESKTNLENGKLAKFFDTVKETAKDVWEVLKNVFTTIMNIGKAAFPSGSGLLKSIGDVTKAWANWTGTPENQKKMRDFFDHIKTIFENVATSIGEIVKKLTPIIDKVIKFAAEHPELVKLATTVGVGAAVVSKVPGAGAVAGVAGQAAGAAAPLVGRGLMAAAPALANPVGLAIGATVLAGFAAYKLSPDAAAMMKGSFAKAFTGIKDAFKGLSDAWGKFWDEHGDTIKKLGKYWADAFGGTVSKLIEGFGKAIEIVIGFVTIIIKLLTGDFKGAWQSTKELLKDVWDFIKDAFAAAWGAVIKFWKDVIWPWLKDLAVTILDAIKSKWESLKEGIAKRWHDLWEGIKDKFNALKDWFASRPKAILGWIADRWNDLKTGFLEKWESLKTSIKDKIDALKTFFSELPGKMLGWIKENWKTKIADPFANLFQGIVDRVKDIWNKLKGLFKTPINWVIDHVINPVIDGVNTLIDKVGGGPKTIQNVTRITADETKAAQGGVLPGWSPGIDNHHFFSPTAGMLHLSGGEAIMRPEWTRAVGGPAAVARMNSLATQGILDEYATGGIWRPTRTGSYAGGIHGSPPAVDVGVGVGTDVHAGHAGRILAYDIPGHEPRVSHGGHGYKSYGRVVLIKGDGESTLYAHLSKRVGSGGSVSGGEKIGESGETGNAHGPHVHFGASGRVGPHAFGQGSTQYKGGKGNFVDGGKPVDPDDSLPGFNPIEWIRDKINAIKEAASHIPGADMFKKIATGIPKMALDTVINWIKDKVNGMINFVKGIPGNALKIGKNIVSGGLRLIGFSGGGLVPGSGSGDSVPGMLSPGEFVMRRSAVDRFGSGTFDRINEASNNMPFSSPADEDRVVRKLDQLIAVMSNQPRQVYGAENVYVDTAADFQRLQQMADWAQRGTKVA